MNDSLASENSKFRHCIQRCEPLGRFLILSSATVRFTLCFSNTDSSIDNLLLCCGLCWKKCDTFFVCVLRDLPFAFTDFIYLNDITCEWELKSSGVWRRVFWCVFTDVSTVFFLSSQTVWQYRCKHFKSRNVVWFKKCAYVLSTTPWRRKAEWSIAPHIIDLGTRWMQSQLRAPANIPPPPPRAGPPLPTAWEAAGPELAQTVNRRNWIQIRRSFCWVELLQLC